MNELSWATGDECQYAPGDTFLGVLGAGSGPPPGLGEGPTHNS